MPNIIGEPFRPYVSNQITQRQKAHGSGTLGTSRTPEQLSYLNSKTAWVKLASGIKIGSKFPSETGIKASSWATLAKQYVLFSGMSQLKDGKLNPRTKVYGNGTGIYDVNLAGNNSSEFGLVPMPGITDAEIKCVNRGSIKKATINFKCYSAEQFRILDVLYLRIGYTMFLEWGWSPFLDNNGNLISDYSTLIESKEGFFNDKWKKSSYQGFLPQIEQYRADKSGNYDGLLCKVTNFSWDFNQDGSYNIQLNLISLGDVVESLTLNTTPPSKISDFINAAYKIYNDEAEDPSAEGSSSGKVPPGPVGNWLSAYFFIQKLYLINEANNEYWKANDCISTFSSKKTPIPVRTKFIKKPSKEAELTAFSTNERTSYSTLEQKSELIQNISEEGGFIFAEGSVQNSDGSGILAHSKKFTLNFDSNQGKHDFVYFSYNTLEDDEDLLNEDGFYIRFGHLLDFIRTQLLFKLKSTDTPIIQINNNTKDNKMYIFPYQVSLDPRVCIVRNDTEPINTKEYHTKLPHWKSASGFGYTMNIYLNCNMVSRILNEKQDDEGNISLFEVLQTICNELNTALGGVNNLEPVLDEDTNTLSILDASYAPPAKKTYTFELFGYNKSQTQSNFVRNFAIKTEITNDFATMASVGSTAGGYVKGVENTMFSKWNKGLIDIFKEEFLPAVGSATTKDEKDPSNLYVQEFWNKRFASFGLTAPQDIPSDVGTPDACAISGEIIDKNVKTVSEFYKYCQSRIQLIESRYASPTAGFIPISLSLTFDGMSGIKIYNAVNVNTSFLPKRYPESLNFIVKGVNHKLSGHDWETSIDTVVIAQNTDKDGKPFLSYKQIKSEVKKIIKTAQVKIAAENPDLPPDIVTPPRDTQFDNSTYGPSPTATTGNAVLGGDADFWSLLTICIFEDGDPQGRADVAQSIYNRVGSGAYSTSIAAVVKSNGQYEPAFAKGTQVTSTVWKNISSKATAIAAVKSTKPGYETNEKAIAALKEVYDTIRDPAYQNQAKSFIQGRTDFLSITQGSVEKRNQSTSAGKYSKDGSRGSFVMRSTGGGNNVYGWAYNYKKNSIAQPPGQDWWNKYKDQF